MSKSVEMTVEERYSTGVITPDTSLRHDTDVCSLTTHEVFTWRSRSHHPLDVGTWTTWTYASEDSTYRCHLRSKNYLV